MRDRIDVYVSSLGYAGALADGIAAAVRAACESEGLRLPALTVTYPGCRGPNRVARARAAASVGLRALGLTLAEIGRVVNLDHTTVLYHLRRHATMAAATTGATT